MLKDRKRLIEKFGRDRRLRVELVQQYGDFLRTLFAAGDWFVTLTFRDRHQDATAVTEPAYDSSIRPKIRHVSGNIRECEPDPRIADWEPDSRYSAKPGPPVRDAALREIEHWLLELGWEAAGHKRQEIFDTLAGGLSGRERRAFAKSLVRKCLVCALVKDPVTLAFSVELRAITTSAIGWVIAEEFGRLGGRWHVHVLVKGVQQLRRKKWWKRAFIRFGRSRIEPIHV
jgi:hypothetical protein